MAEISKEQILEALRVVEDPDLHRDIVTLGFVKDVRVCGGNVALRIELTTPACPVKDMLKIQAEKAVRSLPGVEQVNIEMTAQVRSRPNPGELIPKVRHVIAVASGKGGVGKSTVAANIAIALAKTGAKVGLLDADIYGPSLPTMMGVRQRPLMKETPAGPKIVPVQAHGVLVMSLGFLLEPDKAVVWRGPMVASAVRQMLGDVLWGEQDYLIVDLPPGTGDAPLSLAQLVPLSGVLVVMTPQLVAQEIANKSIAMFRMLSQNRERPIPILGVVENMSGGPFGSGGAEMAAKQLDVPFLGRIPLDAAICAGGDSGTPVVIGAPESEAACAFHKIASSLASQVSILQYAQDIEAATGDRTDSQQTMMTGT
ncbi:MAG TPA: Mrp/NBP35 family ATP-binding protein [Chthonomonas sp.]|uniref:Mrp/NBP35 family ATP-binding protein n=1 Tax=Chthonomonas sp. TaxID=2282153 RepID=UPI002B4B3B40|nr:Mrp/NBP35 family ATP-binding protein [Chthonomonas sp.]HLI47821.1 Mrp/NBP35 family ATP-binding protein [Chthonomonas sp.]